MEFFECVLRPRYEETDQMGVVYHGNYYRYFESGRSELFRSLGYTYMELEKDGVILPIIESQCKYVKSAKYDEEIIIRSKISNIKGIRIEFQYEVIRKSTNELLAIGKTLHIFSNNDLKPIKYSKLPKKFTEVLENIYFNL